MKKNLFCIFSIMASIVGSYIAMPFVIAYFYGRNVELLQNVLILSLAAIIIFVIYAKLEMFVNSEYFFYKVIGMNSFHIIRKFLLNNKIELSIIISAFCVISYTKNIIYNMVLALQLFLGIIILVEYIYIFRHYKKLWNIFTIIVSGILLIEVTKVTLEIYELTQKSITNLKITEIILQNTEI